MTATIDLELKKKIDRYIPDLVPQYEGEKPISPIQIMLYNDWQHKFICCPAGRRARKTLIFMYKGLINWLAKEGNYALCAPTWKQAKKIFWKRLKDLTRLFWDRQPLETDMMVFLQNGSTIFCTGLENADRIEGSPVHGFHITEVDSCKEEMWTAHVLPMGLDTDAYFYLDGVPDGGLGWFYDLCLRASGGSLPERNEVIRGAFAASKENPHMAYYHWKSSDVHPQWKLDEIAKQYIYSEEMFDQEFGGVFISLKGAAYKKYSQLNIMRCDYRPEYPIHIGWDFNRSPMACTFSHVIDNKVYTFNEAVIDDYTTDEMISYILTDLHYPREMCYVYPDSTGKAEKSNARKSDLAQIRDSGMKVFAKSQNPRVKDRIAAQNRLFKDKFGVIRQFVDPRCKYLINDFNKVKCDEYGNIDAEQKKTKLTHVSDAHTYKTSYLFPLQRASIRLA